MPTFYNFTENGVVYSFDDVFVPSDLFREGNLFTWGSGTYGQLGNGVFTGTISTPVTTSSGGANWKQSSSSIFQYTAAIKTDGTLWTWGRGAVGNLGNAATTSRGTPVTTFAGGTNWKQVSVGAVHTAAIKTDGTLWTWGGGTYGQLGNAATTSRSTPVTTFAGGTNWKQVDCGRDFTAAIKTDGTLWTWGYNSGYFGPTATLGTNDLLNRSTPVTTFAGGNNWKQVSAGGIIASAIKTDGTLWSWGYGIGGGITPVTTFAGGTNWKQVSAGYQHTTAIKTDGTLWVWGLNDRVQLGTNDTINKLTPVTTFAGGNNWKQVSAGGENLAGGLSAAVKTDGTLWTWGSGSSGQLGNAAITNRSTPVTTSAGGTNWKQVDCGGNRITALTYDDPGI
jgi:alpha-tubulin suppressor-like RCC1 family protein